MVARLRNGGPGPERTCDAAAELSGPPDRYPLWQACQEHAIMHVGTQKDDSGGLVIGLVLAG